MSRITALIALLRNSRPSVKGPTVVPPPGPAQEPTQEPVLESVAADNATLDELLAWLEAMSKEKENGDEKENGVEKENGDEKNPREMECLGFPGPGCARTQRGVKPQQWRKKHCPPGKKYCNACGLRAARAAGPGYIRKKKTHNPPPAKGTHFAFPTTTAALIS